MQFRLRTLLLFVLLLSVAFTWWKYSIVEPARLEQRAIGAVTTAGGQVETVSSLPDWLSGRLSERFESMGIHVVAVHFLGPTFTDEKLLDVIDDLRHCQRIKTISLVETSVGPAGMEAIQNQLPTVKVLRPMGMRLQRSIRLR